MRRTLGSVLCVLVACVISGCLLLGMGESQVRQQPTIGQELIDLKCALDQGAITPPEYEQVKCQLLQRPR